MRRAPLLLVLLVADEALDSPEAIDWNEVVELEA
jgi:hypothetical protein